jgi:hypothetical protein
VTYNRGRRVKEVQKVNMVDALSINTEFVNLMKSP